MMTAVIQVRRNHRRTSIAVTGSLLLLLLLLMLLVTGKGDHFVLFRFLCSFVDRSADVGRRTPGASTTLLLQLVNGLHNGHLLIQH